MYDQTGSTENPFGDDGQGMNYEDMFSQFASQFGGGFKGGDKGFDPSIFEDFMGMFGGGGQGRGRQPRAPPADIVVNLDIDFKDSVFGTDK
jgi:DnaJ-class molecular chaperone